MGCDVDLRGRAFEVGPAIETLSHGGAGAHVRRLALGLGAVDVLGPRQAKLPAHTEVGATELQSDNRQPQHRAVWWAGGAHRGRGSKRANPQI